MDIRAANVAILSQDPYFCMASQLLLGRYSPTRVISIASSPRLLTQHLGNKAIKLQTIVCDIDSYANSDYFLEELAELLREKPSTNLLWVGIEPFARLSQQNFGLPIRGYLSKPELGYCLHLAVQAAQERNTIWVTHGLVPKLLATSLREEQCKVIPEETLPLTISPRIYEVLILRIVIGLDNKDIQDELGLEYNTVREYVSQAYKVFGVHNEIQAFQAISDWWWDTRFLKAHRPNH